MRQGYVCIGSVRGSCGHVHRTLSGAERCLRRDQSGCSQQGGYSDRRVYRYDDSDTTGGVVVGQIRHHDAHPLDEGEELYLMRDTIQ